MRPRGDGERFPARIWLPLAVVVVGLAFAGGSPVAAQDEGSHDQEISPLRLSADMSNAELEDLAALAEQKGMSLEAAIERYAWNDDLAEAVSQVRDAFPNDYAAAEIVDAGSAWIGFAGSVTEGVVELLENFESNHPWIALELVQEIGFNEATLELAIETVHFAVYGQEGVRDASTTFEFGAREIVTVVAVSGGGDAANLEDLFEAAMSQLQAAGLASVLEHIGVRVVASGHPVLGGADSNTQHRGGESLTTCTSGFIVVSAAGDRGVATAGHCPNTQADDGVNLPFLIEYEGTHGDFQVHDGSQPMPNVFYSGSGTQLEVGPRNVTSVGNPIVGQALCKNGKTNFKSCQDVRKLSVCKSGLCNLVQMEARLAAPGDSGGPIYWEYRAYGFHQGWHYDLWPFDRDVYSRAIRITNAFGVWVATN